jgi:hypothetical protein
MAPSANGRASGARWERDSRGLCPWDTGFDEATRGQWRQRKGINEVQCARVPDPARPSLVGYSAMAPGGSEWTERALSVLSPLSQCAAESNGWK